jgi:GxxExxY protein
MKFHTKSIFKVYNNLGPGLLESVYEHELEELDLAVKTQVPIPVIYNDIKMDQGFRADIIVQGKVLIEIKSVENLAEVHHKQILTYLKLTYPNQFIGKSTAYEISVICVISICEICGK